MNNISKEAKTYECNICNNTYTELSKLNKHKKLRHKTQNASLSDEDIDFASSSMDVLSKLLIAHNLHLDEINKKLKCDCEKDILYQFSCKNAINWFITNILVMKIRRK